MIGNLTLVATSSYGDSVCKIDTLLFIIILVVSFLAGVCISACCLSICLSCFGVHIVNVCLTCYGQWGKSNYERYGNDTWATGSRDDAHQCARSSGVLASVCCAIPLGALTAGIAAFVMLVVMNCHL